MIRRYGLFLMLAAVLWVALKQASLQAGQATKSAGPSADELYTDVYNGWKWWHVYCFRCHGQDALGSTLAPNLTDPNVRSTLPDFLKKVRNGSPDKGMQAWDKLLDDKQITQLYYYVIARADKVLPPGRPDEVGPKGGRWVPPQGWPKSK